MLMDGTFSYYSWSPTVAEGIAGCQAAKVAFRFLLAPVVVTVHAIALIYLTVASFNLTLASIVAFFSAVVLTFTFYIAVPILCIKAIYRSAHAIGRSRFTRKLPAG